MDIRPAATLVLVRDTAEGLEVLLLQRTCDAVFMPGYFVFPGGRVEENETHGQDHIIGPGDAEISQTMSVDEGGADYMLAAVRECFEESGVLVAVDKQGNPISGDHPAHADRRSVFDGDLSLASLCKKHGLALPLDRLAYLGHWITPPGPPRRFDTRFFVTPAPEGQLAGHDGIETIDHVWIRPEQALEDHRNGQRLLGLPTIRTLRVLNGFETTDALMRYAHANPPEPYPNQPWPALPAPASPAYPF